jgi:hypothetical protein
MNSRNKKERERGAHRNKAKLFDGILYSFFY